MLLTPEEMKARGLTEQPWAVVTGELRRNKKELKTKIMKPIPTTEELKDVFSRKIDETCSGMPIMNALKIRDAFVAVLDHLKPWLSAGTQLAPSGLPWVSLKERRPTREDCAPFLQEAVLFTNGEQWLLTSFPGIPVSATHFLPFSPPAQPSQDELDRAAFEKAFPDYHLEKVDGKYLSDPTEYMWRGFKQALDLTRKQS